MGPLIETITAYADVFRKLLMPIVDGQPAASIAVNPAPIYRSVVEDAQTTRAFRLLALAFEVSCRGEDAVRRSSKLSQYRWLCAGYLRNSGFYDTLIRGEPIDAPSVATAIVAESSREDVTFANAVYLDSFETAGAFQFGSFSIRHLRPGEIDALFAGRCQLDQRDIPERIHAKVADAWFLIDEGPAEALEMTITFPWAIGQHDMEGTFRNANLALNLFKSAAGPVVLSHTYSWNSSLFHRQQHDCPEPDAEFYPASWSGPEDDEPPPFRLYSLSKDDLEAFRAFWEAFEQRFLNTRRYLPQFLHRAIGRFLEACKVRRSDYESRQSHYIMALEALFSGEEDEHVRPILTYWDRSLKRSVTQLRRNKDTQLDEPIQAYASDSITKCCASLLDSPRIPIDSMQDWLYKTYKSRSRITHGSSSEQAEFYPRGWSPIDDPPEKAMCNRLGIDAGSVWYGQDYALGVLHNVVRRSLLRFIDHAARCVQLDPFKSAISQIERLTGHNDTDERTRRQMREELHFLWQKEKHQLLQALFDGYKYAPARQQVATATNGLLQYSR